jgi:hypothetical protein
MSDPARTTGVYKHTDDRGKERTIVQIASDIKVVAGTIGVVASMIVGGAIWFNGYIQAKATEGFTKQINSDDSAIRAAFKTMIDERAEEIETNLKVEITRSRDLSKEEWKDVRGMIWRATNPARLAGDPIPLEPDDLGGD